MTRKSINCSAQETHPPFSVIVQKNKDVGIIQDWGLNIVLNISCVALSRLCKLSEPQLIHLEQEMIIPTQRVVDGITKIIQLRQLTCYDVDSCFLPSLPSFLSNS